MAVLQVDALRCDYGEFPAVSDVSFTVERGEVACLLGPSGSGKSTVLRAIAGFQPLRGGRIILQDRLVSDVDTMIAPENRRIGMVFQDHALFPHLNVLNNVAAGLMGIPRGNRKHRVLEVLRTVGLSGFEHRFPHELSGGQSQRVALARALAPSPALLLMDEPFSNLDLQLRDQLGVEVRDIIKQTNTTCVLVTHDQFDAFALGDYVGVLSEGRLKQWDTPYNLYHEPRSRFVASFIGDGVFLPGQVTDVTSTQICVDTEIGNIHSEEPTGFDKGAQVDVLIRPDDLVPNDGSPYQGRVLRKAFKGAGILYTLELASGRRALALFPSHMNHALNDHVGIQLAADHLVAFNPESDFND